MLPSKTSTPPSKCRQRLNFLLTEVLLTRYDELFSLLFHIAKIQNSCHVIKKSLNSDSKKFPKFNKANKRVRVRVVVFNATFNGILLYLVVHFIDLNSQCKTNKKTTADSNGNSCSLLEKETILYNLYICYNLVIMWQAVLIIILKANCPDKCTKTWHMFCEEWHHCDLDFSNAKIYIFFTRCEIQAHVSL